MARILPSLGRVFASTYKGPAHLGKPTRSSKIISDASPEYKLGLAGLAASGTTNLMKKIGAEVAVRALQHQKDSKLPEFGSPASGSSSHTVVSGDTLGRIASKNSTTVDELARLNSIRDPNRIAVGQKIKLPGSEGITPEYLNALKELNNPNYGGRPPRAARAMFLEEAARVLNNANIDEETRSQVMEAANRVRTGRPGGYMELAKDMIMGPSAQERADLGALSREQIAAKFVSADTMPKRKEAFQALEGARGLNPGDFAQESSLTGLLTGEQSRIESKHFEDMFPPIPKPARRTGGGQPQKFTVREPKDLRRALNSAKRTTRHLYGIARGDSRNLLKIPAKHFNFMKTAPEQDESGNVEIAIPFELLNNTFNYDGAIVDPKTFMEMSARENFMPKASFLDMIKRGYELKKEVQTGDNVVALGKRLASIQEQEKVNIWEPAGAATWQVMEEINRNRSRVSAAVDALSTNKFSWFENGRLMTPGTERWKPKPETPPTQTPSPQGKGKGKGKVPPPQEKPALNPNRVNLGD